MYETYEIKRALNSEFRVLNSGNNGSRDSGYESRLVPLFSFFFFLFSFSFSFAQTPANDNCANASLLCPNAQLPSNNINATAQCGGGPDGDCGFGTWCFTVTNSVWFKFVTNDIGGEATVSTTNYSGSLDGVLLYSSLGCDTSGYIIHDCKNNEDTTLSLTSATLQPNTVYWVMIDGASANQTNFQIAVFGVAVEWTIQKTSTDATCDNSCDGTATVTPAQGTSPYTYLWDSNAGNQATQTATGLCMGTYNVTVTDSIGCEALTTVTIGALPPATVSVTSTDEQCPNSCNGTATAVLSSGQMPYSYSWNTSPVQTGQTATGLCSGTFSVTVTDSLGCDTSASVNIATLPPATLSISSADAQCPCSGSVSGSGTATATLSSGPAPVTYIWSTIPVQTSQTATGLCPGNYTVTVTDSVGCDTSGSITINLLPSPEASVSTDVKCGTGCTSTATASFSSSQTPYTYLWSTSPVQTGQTATGLCPGTDSVIVTDNAGCRDTVPFTISPPPDISEVSVISTDAQCGMTGSAVSEVGGGTEPYTYQWSNGGTVSGITDLSPGTYSVTVTDANNCTGTAEGTVKETECEIKPADKFSPNGDGINDTWNITNAEKYPDNKVFVYNRWGQKVYSSEGYDNSNVVWEGKLIPDAIYYYVIYKDKNNKKDKENILYGNVTILR